MESHKLAYDFYRRTGGRFRDRQVTRQARTEEAGIRVRAWWAKNVRPTYINHHLNL